MPVSIGDIAKRMLTLLPPDGTPVLNRVMRVMLTTNPRPRSTRTATSRRATCLLRQGRVGIQRGQGGQIFLLPEKTRKSLNPARSRRQRKRTGPKRG